MKLLFCLSKKGFTLIETMTVVFIISLFTFIGFISFSDSKNSITISSSGEILNDSLLLMQNQVITEILLSTELIFSLDHPLLFYFKNSYNISPTVRGNIAWNMDITSITEPSSILLGNLTLGWVLGKDSEGKHSKIVFQAKKGTNFLHTEKNFIDENDATLFSAPTIPMAPLNESQKYEFILMDKNSEIISEKIILRYFSPNNISVNAENNIFLSEIQVQNFFDDWITVNEASINFSQYFLGRKYYSEQVEYKALRIILKRGEDEETYTF